MFEAVGFYDVHGGEKHAQFSRRESFSFEPLEIRHRQSCNFPTLVFSKWHLGNLYFNENLGVGYHCTLRMLICFCWNIIVSPLFFPFKACAKGDCMEMTKMSFSSM